MIPSPSTIMSNIMKVISDSRYISSSKAIEKEIPCETDAIVKSIECINRPPACSGHTCDIINNKLILYGGYNKGLCSSSVYECDLITYEWKELEMKGKDIPLGRASHSMTPINNHSLLVVGGSGPNFGYNNYKDVYICDIEGLEWIKLKCEGDVPDEDGIYGHSVICISPSVFLLYGGTSGLEFYSNVYTITLLSNERCKWKRIKVGGICHPSGRYRHGCIKKGRNVYMIGGGETLAYDGHMEVWELNLDTWIWTEKHCKGDNIKSRIGHTCSLINDKKVLVAGGRGRDEVRLSECLYLDLETFEWNKILNFQIEARDFHASCVNNKCMYIFGGASYVSNQDKVVIRRNDLIRFQCDFNPCSLELLCCKVIKKELKDNIMELKDILPEDIYNNICSVHTDSLQMPTYISNCNN